MSPRTRTHSDSDPKGTDTRFGYTWGVGGTVLRELSTISDHTGPGDGDPLLINRWRSSGGHINNDYYSWYGAHFVDYIADVLDNDSNFPHLDVTNVGPTNVDAATQAAARTSPSAPIVDVAASLLELADVVQMIKTTGENLIGKIASTNLRLQFGMLPLVRDLEKLTEFQSHVARRMRTIRKLRETGSYRKTVNIGHYELYGQSNIYAQSSDALIIVAQRVKTHVAVRAHCRWIPSEDYSLMEADEMRALARRAVVNLNVNYSALWEAMPWSWMLDWCGNVGQFLKAHSNTIPATLSSVFVARHTVTEYDTDAFSDPSSGNRTMTPIRFFRETKSRTPSFVALTARWPFLRANQLGILASLSVKR